jgi:hypothetical protein
MPEINGFHNCVERPLLGWYTAFGLIASLPFWLKKRVFTNKSVFFQKYRILSSEHP